MTNGIDLRLCPQQCSVCHTFPQTIFEIIKKTFETLIVLYDSEDVFTTNIVIVDMKYFINNLQKPPFQKSAVFLNIVQKAFDPPPPFI